MTTKFCTELDVRNELDLPKDHHADDDLIGHYIESATALIRSYTRREWTKARYVAFYSTADIDTLVGVGDNFVPFFTPEIPLSNASGEEPELKFNTGGNWADTTALDAGYYEVDTVGNKIIMYPGAMHSRGRSLRISYTAGYAVSADDATVLVVDAALRNACAIQTAFAFRRTKNETSGKKRAYDKSGLSDFALTQSGLVREAVTLIQNKTRIFIGAHA